MSPKPDRLLFVSDSELRTNKSVVIILLHELLDAKRKSNHNFEIQASILVVTEKAKKQFRTQRGFRTHDQLSTEPLSQAVFYEVIWITLAFPILY